MKFRVIELSVPARKLLHASKPFTKAQVFDAYVAYFLRLSYEERRSLVIDYYHRVGVPPLHRSTPPQGMG